MKEAKTQISTLHQLLDQDARNFTVGEVELQKQMPRWINLAGSVKFKTILQRYFDMINQHIQKMESFFEEEEIFALSTKNSVIEACINDTNEKLSCCADPETKDACLLAGIQTINHIKISRYGTAAAYARALEMDNQALVFRELEVNEKQIDDRLTQLAEFEINRNAKTPIVLSR